MGETFDEQLAGPPPPPACIPCRRATDTQIENGHCEREEHPIVYLDMAQVPSCRTLGYCAERLFSEDLPY